MTQTDKPLCDSRTESETVSYHEWVGILLLLLCKGIISFEALAQLKNGLSAPIFTKLNINMMFKNYSRELFSIKQVVSVLSLLKEDGKSQTQKSCWKHSDYPQRPGKVLPDFSSGSRVLRQRGISELGSRGRRPAEWRGCSVLSGRAEQGRQGWASGPSVLPCSAVLRLQQVGLRAQDLVGRGQRSAWGVGHRVSPKLASNWM